jgi:hypothetical protein
MIHSPIFANFRQFSPIFANFRQFSPKFANYIEHRAASGPRHVSVGVGRRPDDATVVDDVVIRVHVHAVEVPVRQRPGNAWVTHSGAFYIKIET